MLYLHTLLAVFCSSENIKSDHNPFRENKGDHDDPTSIFLSSAVVVCQSLFERVKVNIQNRAGIVSLTLGMSLPFDHSTIHVHYLTGDGEVN